MDNFLIFVAPFLVVIASIGAAFFVATRMNFIDEE